MIFLDFFNVSATWVTTSPPVLSPGAGVVGGRTLAQCITDGDVSIGSTNVVVVVTDGTTRELGLYTVGGTAQAPTLTRSSVVRNSAGGTNPVAFAGNATLTAYGDVPASFLMSLLSSGSGVAPSGLTMVTTMTAADTVLISQDGSNIVGILASNAKTYLGAGGAGGTAAALSIGTIPTPQAVGTAFTVSGTWTGTQPTGLTYATADNGGALSAYTAMNSVVINANGTWTASVTPSSASTSRTMVVKDTGLGTVSGASNPYVVNSGSATLTASNYTVSNANSAFNDPTTGTFGSNPYFGVTAHVQIRQTSDTTKFPAAHQLKGFWTRVTGGLPTVMTDLPYDQRFTGGAWPAGITYTSNGGAATGTAPNSVQLLSDGGYAVPGTFTADSPGLFGGGAPGNYALVIAFPDGTFVCRPQLVAVS